jgi:hypothetical protein
MRRLPWSDVWLITAVALLGTAICSIYGVPFWKAYPVALVVIAVSWLAMNPYEFGNPKAPENQISRVLRIINALVIAATMLSFCLNLVR